MIFFYMFIKYKNLNTFLTCSWTKKLGAQLSWPVFFEFKNSKIVFFSMFYKLKVLEYAPCMIKWVPLKNYKKYTNILHKIKITYEISNIFISKLYKISIIKLII